MFTINKGVDRPPEVLGIRGMNFLMILAFGTVGMLVFTALSIAIFSLSSVYGFGVFILAVFVLYNKLVQFSKKYGERGYAKFQARKKFPAVVTVRSSAAFKLERESIKPKKLR